MLENNEKVAHAIFEVFEYGKDKEELIEDIKLLHAVKEKGINCSLYVGVTIFIRYLAESILAAIEDDKDIIGFNDEDVSNTKPYK